MRRSLIDVYGELDEDERVKAIVLCAAPAHGTFCAGADLRADGFGIDPAVSPRDHRDKGARVLRG